jgi:hypothetical protein
MLHLEKIGSALNTDCPHRGHSITPAERTHVDNEHLECPRCHKRFAPGKENPISGKPEALAFISACPVLANVRGSKDTWPLSRALALSTRANRTPPKGQLRDCTPLTRSQPENLPV